MNLIINYKYNNSCFLRLKVFMDVHSMMFVGFGFLMTFLKKYGYSAIGFNFILAAFVLEWSMLVEGWIEMIKHETSTFDINVKSLLVSDFSSAAVLISFGAVIGKVSLSQLLIMALIEVVFQRFNEYVGLHHIYVNIYCSSPAGKILMIFTFKAYDVGESIYVHVFGAYFGLAVAKMLHNKRVANENESATYVSDLFSMIGTLFLWLYWPSFNSATATGEGQLRAIVNTYLSITASCIFTAIISSLLAKGRLNMVSKRL
jgi:ammonium transporter Rh